MLWMLQRVLFGKITNPENAELPDLNKREIGLLVPLMILMLFMGVYPRVFLDRSKASVESIRDRVSASPAGGSYTTSVEIGTPSWTGSVPLRGSVGSLIQPKSQGQSVNPTLPRDGTDPIQESR